MSNVCVGERPPTGILRPSGNPALCSSESNKKALYDVPKGRLFLLPSTFHHTSPLDPENAIKQKSDMNPGKACLLLPTELRSQTRRMSQPGGLL